MRKPPPSPRTAGPDYPALAAFRATLRRFLSFSAAAARAVGLTPQQHQALLAIKGFPVAGRLSIRELAERLDSRHHSVVGLVDRLARRQLVRRAADPADARRVRLCLTARGEKILARLSAAHHEELQRLGPELRRLLKQLGK